MERIEFNRLTARSVFKVGYFSVLGLALPLALVAGLLALGGADTVSFNGYVHGIGGLVAGVVLGLLLPAIFAAFMVLGSLVVRLSRSRGPRLDLRRG